MKSRLSTAVRNLDPYLTKQISAAAEADPSVVNLSLGEPWFGPPPHVADMVTDIAQTATSRRKVFGHYAPVNGSQAYREAIAARYARLYGMAVDADREIVATGGGASAFMVTVLALTDPGDEVIVFDPTYMLYERSCRLLGRVPVRAERSPENGFAIDAALLERHVTPRTKLAVLNSPENPTGYVCPADVLAEIVTACERNGITLVHDEVYDDFIFDAVHTPARVAAKGSASVVQINSFSKRFGMLGLRLGWIVAAPEIAEAAARVHDYMALSVSGVSEEIGTKLLTSPDVHQWVGERTKELAQNRSVILEAMSRVPGVALLPGLPKGGMFLFANVEELAAQLAADQNAPEARPGRIVARHFFDDVKVAVVPGDIYGTAGTNFIRLVFAVEPQQLRRAAAHLAGAISVALR